METLFAVLINQAKMNGAVPTIKEFERMEATEREL